MSKKAKIILALLIIPVVFVLFYKFNPEQTGFFPKCPMYHYTGIKCPGCGTQRAIHQLLHFNLMGAIHYNLLMVLSLPVMAFTLAADNFKDRLPRCYKIAKSPLYTRSIVIAVCLWFILRNIFNW